MQFSYVASHVEEYTLTGILSKFLDNKESHVLQRNILGCLSNRNKGKGQSMYFSVWLSGIFVGQRLLCLTGAVLTQIQYDYVSRSHQLLRCMATRLDPIEAGGTLYPPPTDFYLAVPKLFTVLPRRPSHLILEYNITKYKTKI